MQYNEFNISVRNLVESVLKSGSLGNDFTGSARLVEGIRIHRKLQKSRGADYKAEVLLKDSIEYRGLIIHLEGRADGIFTDEGISVIEEIKSIDRSPDELSTGSNEIHWAQARCYAYMYARQNALEKVGIQLTYYMTDRDEAISSNDILKFTELEDYFFSLLEGYYRYLSFTAGWKLRRDLSIKEIKFPYESYRRGQRDMVRAVYKTISDGNRLFVQAPTGIGKTISALFPAIKTLGNGLTSKIFYLTARTTTRQVAEEALDLMQCKGLELKVITLTAKEKLCFNRGAGCDPMLCKYADGYYDRIDDAVLTLLESGHNLFTRDIIEEYARRYRVCPFDFSLDVALSTDCIICDYNYLFDPGVFLKRFFMSRGDYVFLIDEAHNLVDRARDMYSAELLKSRVLNIKRQLRGSDPGIYKLAGKLNDYMIKLKKECVEYGQAYKVTEDGPEELYPILREFIKAADVWLGQNKGFMDCQELLDFYFSVLMFLKIAEYYDRRYVTYVDTSDRDVKLKLYCTDPSFLLNEACKRGGSAIFFSATLTPLSYFKDILGGGQDSRTMRLASPFYSENLCLLVADEVSTKYKNREGSYDIIAEYIHAVVGLKTGNFMVYFPSYKYLYEVVARFAGVCPDVTVLVQSSVMTEKEREAFLAQFKPDPDKTLVGFGVMGGIFSEGIDLKGDRLSGTVIVGVGLPQVNLEQDIIMRHFQERNGMGFEYSYMYPGMNKVLQAAGRVIRSETDRGVVLLIDERFTQDNYQELFPDNWSHFRTVGSPEELEYYVSRFREQG